MFNFFRGKMQVYLNIYQNTIKCSWSFPSMLLFVSKGDFIYQGRYSRQNRGLDTAEVTFIAQRQEASGISYCLSMSQVASTQGNNTCDSLHLITCIA